MRKGETLILPRMKTDKDKRKIFMKHKIDILQMTYRSPCLTQKDQYSNTSDYVKVLDTIKKKKQTINPYFHQFKNNIINTQRNSIKRSTVRKTSSSPRRTCFTINKIADISSLQINTKNNDDLQNITNRIHCHKIFEDEGSGNTSLFKRYKWKNSLTHRIILNKSSRIRDSSYQTNHGGLYKIMNQTKFQHHSNLLEINNEQVQQQYFDNNQYNTKTQYHHTDNFQPSLTQICVQKQSSQISQVESQQNQEYQQFKKKLKLITSNIFSIKKQFQIQKQKKKIKINKTYSTNNNTFDISGW